MKATDLMIGDWLIPATKNTPDRVHELTYQEDMSGKYDVVEFENNRNVFFYISFCKPIPLTVEILKKNDFAYCNDDGGCYGYFEESYSNQTMEIALFHVKSEYRNVQLHIREENHKEETMLHLMECNYVHQLQHVLKVCGIKKEIEL